MTQIKIQHNNGEVIIPVWIITIIISIFFGVLMYGFNLTLHTLTAKDTENEKAISNVLSLHTKDTGDTTKKLSVMSRNVLRICTNLRISCENDPLAMLEQSETLTLK